MDEGGEDEVEVVTGCSSKDIRSMVIVFITLLKAFVIVSLKEGEQGGTEMCRCFEAKIYSDLEASNVGTQQPVVALLRSTTVGVLVIHDVLLLLSKTNAGNALLLTRVVESRS
jgi:hypothetical protein